MRFADRADVEAIAQDMPMSYLQCRALGHTWRSSSAAIDRVARAYDVELRCSRCRTIRVQTVSFTGHVVSSHYEYPDGYVNHLGRIAGDGRDALRLESIVRIIDRKGGV
jgi:hypothetical protein